MGSALTRYRVMAYIVGVLLIFLGVAMLVKYVGGNPTPVSLVAPTHGFLYMVYLAATYDLAHRRQWSWLLMIVIMLAGTIPFLSFVAEHRIVKRERVAARVGADAPA